MQDKICLISGATSGIGYETARKLAGNGMQLILHARDQEKAERVRQTLRQETGNTTIDIRIADLSSLQEVAELAEGVKQDYSKLDLLINNAGLILGNQRRTSPDGNELTIAINHLAPFLLTAKLLDRLAGAEQARVINVASDAYRAASPDFEDFQMEHSYSGMLAYGNTKLYNIMFTEELARRLQSRNPNIATYSLHPGTVATNFSNSAGGFINLAFRLLRPFLTKPEQGAETPVFLATEPYVPASGGAYFKNKKPTRVRHKFFTDENNRKLWQRSEELTGISFLSE